MAQAKDDKLHRIKPNIASGHRSTGVLLALQYAQDRAADTEIPHVGRTRQVDDAKRRWHKIRGAPRARRLHATPGTNDGLIVEPRLSRKSRPHPYEDTVLATDHAGVERITARTLEAEPHVGLVGREGDQAVGEV